MKVRTIAGMGGEKYVPYDERKGNESIVYFTRDLSAEGLKKIYEKVNANMTGKVGIKLHTGEQNGPNIIPRPWVKELMASESELKDAAIVETNTFYEGDRYTTEQHRETLKVNGWDFCPVDIMDEDGTVLLPIEGGKWMKEMSHGSHMLDYDSMLVLTHFKGHTMGGFGGNPEFARCLRELNVARALVACGDYEGLGRKTFEDYAEDGRGVLALHARAVLEKYFGK